MNKTTTTILKALINGKTIQQQNPTADLSYIEVLHLLMLKQEYRLRVKSKIVRIGDFDVPEPCRTVLTHGQKFWIAAPFGENENHYRWSGDSLDRNWLMQGRIHTNLEAAQIHTEALLSFTKEPK